MKTPQSIPQKLSLLLLISVVAINAMWPVFFTAGRFVVKQNQAETINEGTDEEEYITTTFTSAEVKKRGISNAKELKINGELFDVVSIVKDGQDYVFTLLCDEEETLLDKAFTHYTKHHHKQPRHKTVTSVFLFYFLNDRLQDNSIATTAIYSSYADSILGGIHPGYLSITSPPPKLAA